MCSLLMSDHNLPKNICSFVSRLEKYFVTEIVILISATLPIGIKWIYF